MQALPQSEPGNGTQWHPRTGIALLGPEQLVNLRLRYLALLGNPDAQAGAAYFRGLVGAIDELMRRNTSE
jgi:hypothetical protein